MFEVYRKKGRRPWWLQGSAGGSYYRQSTFTTNRAEAEAYAAKFYQEIVDRVVYGSKRVATFAQAVELHIQNGGETRFLMPLLDLFGSKRIADLTPIDFANGASAAYPGRKPSTVVRQFYGPLKAVLNRAAEAGLCDAIRIKGPRIKRERPSPASDDYLGDLVKNASPRLRALIIFITYTGARIGEACRLKASDIDWLDLTAILRKTKNGDPRVVALTAQAVEALRAIDSGEDDSRVFGFATHYGAVTAIKRHAKREGLEYIRPHRLGRHAFAARLLKQGHSLKVVQEAGGWKTITMVANNYGHLERKQVDDAVRGASPIQVPKTKRPSRKAMKPGASE